MNINRLFWMNKPRLLMQLYRYAYFENSFSIGLFLFYLWQVPHHTARWAESLGMGHCNNNRPDAAYM